MKDKPNKISVKGLIFLILFVCATIVTIVFDGYIFGNESIFDKDITGIVTIDALYKAVPSVIRSVQIITVALALFWILKLIVPHTVSKNNHANTIIRLIHSIIKWIIFIITAIAVLATFGVDTTALIASAGVLTLVIGLGAQSLFADIIAGIFNVFESNFQVGDIVLINDWRGTVQEIGLRTTKLIDWRGNVNVINNSKIEKVINLSKNPSIAEASVRIEYDQDVAKIERIIKDNLPAIKAAIPAITEGPFYQGINELGDWGIQLYFTAYCSESDLYPVQRAINKQLKLICDAHGIKIAKTQIIVKENLDESKNDTP